LPLLGSIEVTVTTNGMAGVELIVSAPAILTVE